MTQYRCQLERLGAPRWSCASGGVVLGLIVVIYLGIISVSLWNRPGTPRWALPLLLALGALALALAVRSALAAVRNPDPGAAGTDPARPSDNRWRGP